MRECTDRCRDEGRRAFLVRAAIVAAAPLAASACRREPPPAGTPLEPAPAEPLIRVRLAVPPADGAMVGESGRWVRVGDGTNAATDLILRGPVLVRRSGTHWRLRAEDGFEPDLGIERALTITVIEGGATAGSVAVDGRRYPGEVRAEPRREGFHLVNHLPLETYLPGVLASELYRHWHAETFAAQAVAARSFALSEITLTGDRRHYDVVAGPRSQAYEGATDHEPSVEAVARTRGLVLAHDGRPIPGYYSSCCGGTAARAIDAIGSHPANTAAPLQGRAAPDHCAAAPRYRWTITRPRREVEEGLRRHAERRGLEGLSGAGRLRAIEVARVNPHGRPVRHVVVGASGRVVEIDAEVLRRAINASAAARETLHSSDMRAVVTRDEVVFHGRGFGHGVGLCQYGSEAMARDGAAHDVILGWYYPGGQLMRAYG